MIRLSPVKSLKIYELSKTFRKLKVQFSFSFNWFSLHIHTYQFDIRNRNIDETRYPEEARILEY